MTWTKKSAAWSCQRPAADEPLAGFFHPINQLPWPSPSAEKVWFPGRRKSHSQKDPKVVNKKMVVFQVFQPSHLQKKKIPKKNTSTKKNTTWKDFINRYVVDWPLFFNKKLLQNFGPFPQKASGFSRPSRGSWGIRTLDQCHRHYTWGRPGFASKRQETGDSWEAAVGDCQGLRWF